MDYSAFNTDMPLLEGDDFFKNMDALEQDFLIEGEIQDFDEEDENDVFSEDDDETIVE